MGTALGDHVSLRLRRALGTDLCGAGTPTAIIPASERRAWFRADQGITLNGSTVSGWANIWGNGDLAQATAANQPVYTASAINGHPALTNADSVRTMTGALTTKIASGARWWIWIYGRMVAGGAANRYLLTVTAATGGSPYGRSGTSATGGRVAAGVHNGGGSFTNALFASAPDGKPHLYEVGLASTAQPGVGFVSGSNLGSTIASANTSANMGTEITIFVNSLNGDVCEWILKEGLPTAAQQRALRQYFRTRYGDI